MGFRPFPIGLNPSLFLFGSFRFKAAAGPFFSSGGWRLRFGR